MGDSVSLEATVVGVKILSGPNSPVLLDLGAAYPNQLLTIAVFPSFKTSSTGMPTEAVKGSTVHVTGKVELYKGKSQIAVRYPGQLSFSNSAAKP